MSLKNKFFSILTVAIAVAALSTFTLAQDKTAPTPDTTRVEKGMRGEGRGDGHRKFGRKGHGMHRGGFGLRGVDLTDAQKAQIRSIREANKPDAAVMQELRTIRESRKAGTEITPEQKERMKALREQSRAKMKLVHEQIVGILTAEQKATIEKRRDEMKQRFQDRKLRRQQKPADAATDKPKVS